MLNFSRKDLACPFEVECVFKLPFAPCAHVAELADALDSGSSE